jgi:hypothetical protein
VAEPHIGIGALSPTGSNRAGLGSDRVGSGQFDSVRLSGHGSSRVESGLLVSDYFRFRVVSGRIGSVIESFNVGSFRISGRIKSGRLLGHLVSGYFGFPIVSGWVGSVIGSSSVGSFRVSDRIKSGWVGYRII